MPPTNEIQEIVYQTILPHYSPNIIEEYNDVSPGIGNKIYDMIQNDIKHLNESKERWNKMKSSFFFSKPSFKEHLSKCGYNTSGKYLGREFYGHY